MRVCVWRLHLWQRVGCRCLSREQTPARHQTGTLPDQEAAERMTGAQTGGRRCGVEGWRSRVEGWSSGPGVDGRRGSGELWCELASELDAASPPSGQPEWGTGALERCCLLHAGLTEDSCSLEVERREMSQIYEMTVKSLVSEASPLTFLLLHLSGPTSNVSK